MSGDRQPSEFELIARYFAPLSAAAPGAARLLDDAAILTVEPGHELVVSTDTVVETVHFLAGEGPGDVAARLLAVGFSDIAAMGARPLAYTVSVTLPRAWNGVAVTRWVGGFAAGLGAAQADLGADLVGGDTVVAPGPLALTVTAFGVVEAGRALRRSGAEADDDVYVSGTIGDGALGLLAQTGRLPRIAPSAAAALVERFRRPAARIGIGRALVGIASAAADISDGLVADLGHVCTASGVTATIEAGRIPLSPAARAAIAADADLWRAVLTGGDDYELVFTAPPAAAAAVAAVAAASGLALTAVGRIDAVPRADGGGPVRVIGADGAPMRLERGGFTHL